jgi:hypothetical protein
VCVTCPGLYVAARVLAVELADTVSATRYAQDLLAFEFGRYGGGAAWYRAGATWTEPDRAIRLAGQHVYAIQSSVPPAIELLLTASRP